MAKPQRQNNSRREVKAFDEEVIQVDRVTRVVKGGRRLRFRATVVIGDRKGKIGYGIGKSTEVQAAIQKAVTRAQKSLVKVPIYNGTIPHQVDVKFKAAKIMIKPASVGTGVIAGGPIRKMLDLAGVKNVLSKSFGSNNRLNTTKAAYKALSMLRSRPDTDTDYDAEQKRDAKHADKAAPQVKQMSAKDAKSQVHADKRFASKSAGQKPATQKPAEPKTAKESTKNS